MKSVQFHWLSDRFRIKSKYDIPEELKWGKKIPNFEEDVEDLELSCTLSGSINW